jgi:Zn ribbon nucleic-acid-binding protein
VTRVVEIARRAENNQMNLEDPLKPCAKCGYNSIHLDRNELCRDCNEQSKKEEEQWIQLIKPKN